jgi:hypothetical protein
MLGECIVEAKLHTMDLTARDSSTLIGLQPSLVCNYAEETCEKSKHMKEIEKARSDSTEKILRIALVIEDGGAKRLTCRCRAGIRRASYR